MIYVSDIDSRGLEYSFVLRDAKDQPLGGALLRGLDDLRQLRLVQLARGHSRRRLFQSGKEKTR